MYGLPPPREPIQPYDQYVQASVESSSGAASRNELDRGGEHDHGPRRGRRSPDQRASATRYVAKAPSRRTRKERGSALDVPALARHERRVGLPGKRAGGGDEGERRCARRDRGRAPHGVGVLAGPDGVVVVVAGVVSVVSSRCSSSARRSTGRS